MISFLISQKNEKIIVIPNGVNKPEILKALVYAKNYGVKNVPGCEYYSTNRLDIEFEDVPKHSWGLDGEEYKDIKIHGIGIEKDELLVHLSKALRPLPEKFHGLQDKEEARRRKEAGNYWPRYRCYLRRIC